MLHRAYTPGPPLSDFVELLWLYDGYTQPHAMERLLPDGSMELVIDLRNDKVRSYDPDSRSAFETGVGSVVVGAQSGYFVLDTACQASVIGAHFKPGGAFPFFRLPMDELRDQHVPLEALWGSFAVDLRDRLLEAKTPEGRLGILEQALLSRIVKPPARHRAVNFALREFERGPLTIGIADIEDRIGLSPKRFIQVFREEVGLTPKLFCRVRRFQEVLRRVAHPSRVDWADVALSCGYFDQAHFIHDFRAFSGISPSAYLCHRTEHVNHVPILD
jgi:AraC-like DNA-binding protein